MKIKNLAIESIKPYWRNPRDNTLAVEAVMASITDFGFNQPLVVDADNIIVVGHTRYKAAMALGLETVPVLTLEGLTPQQVKAYRIADNKAGEFATWDDTKLISELREIGDAADMSVFFTDGELDKLLEEAGGVDFSDPTQDQIDKATDKAANQFDSIETNQSANQVEVICTHCGEISYISRDHLMREMDAKVQ